MPTLKEKINEAVAAIQKKVSDKPDVAVVLGTGLGKLTETIETIATIDYTDIPHFPRPTVASHTGNMVFGRIGTKIVCALEGRFHFYEGHSLETVTFPVRVMRALGAETLVVSNAAGGMNTSYQLGDLMLITDHINLMGVNPLIGPNDDTLGPRFPDMFEPYNAGLADLAEVVAKEENIAVQKGVYVAVTGPNLETPAEYKFLSIIGADAVGMSTVPEVIVGVHCGFKILGVSCITDLCYPGALEPVNLPKILAVARDAEPKLSALITKTIERM